MARPSSTSGASLTEIASIVQPHSVVGLAVEEVEVAGQLLDTVDLTPALDLDGDHVAVGVTAQRTNFCTMGAISDAVVIGDRRKYLTALVTLDEDAVAKFCSERGLNGEPAHERPEVRAEIQKAIDAMNRELAQVETVKKFAIPGRNFTVDDGELTPTLKVKRRIVAENWTDEIEAMYEGQAPGSN